MKTTAIGGHHFNYEIQAWITYGRVKVCGHRPLLNLYRGYCCNAARYVGLTESAAVAAERERAPHAPSREELADLFRSEEA